MNRRQMPAFAASAAAHVVCLALAIWLSKPRSFAVWESKPAPRVPGSGMIVVAVQPATAAPSPNRGAASRTRAPEVAPDEQPLFRRSDADSTLTIPGFTFDYAKVADRARWLFPFLSLRVPLESRASADPSRRPRLVNPFARAAPAGSSLPPLVLSDSGVRSVVDGAWSRRERWHPFQAVAELTRRYSPDAGALPMLLRKYVDDNLLQPYLDTVNRDARLWTELAIAAQHRDFIDFVAQYASRYPSSKATTELMFLLEKLAQGSYDALMTLVDTSPNDLIWTRDANREAYNLLVLLRRYYTSELALRDLGARGSLRLFYDSVRVAILREIVNTTPDGYRANDARFLIGTIYWRQDRVEDALRSWRGITTIDPKDGYVAAYSQIVAALRRAGVTGAIDRGRINRILDDERHAWVEFWRMRLEEFGYAFDAY